MRPLCILSLQAWFEWGELPSNITQRPIWRVAGASCSMFFEAANYEVWINPNALESSLIWNTARQQIETHKLI